MNKKTPIVIFAALGIYAVAILIWAVLFLAANRAYVEHEECDLGVRTMSEAWIFSLETMTTLGYGVPQGQDVYFHSCPSLLVLVSLEALCSVLLDALAIGIVFMRISRAQSRAASVIFSSRAVLRRIRGEWYLMFRVVEMRKHQLTEAHIRCYALRHMKCGREGETPAVDNEDTAFQSCFLRLQHPDDELGAPLLLTLPSTVVHRVDRWSPLWPFEPPKDARRETCTDAACDRHCEGNEHVGIAAPGTHPATTAYRFPELAMREADAESGQRDAYTRRHVVRPNGRRGEGRINGDSEEGVGDVRCESTAKWQPGIQGQVPPVAPSRQQLEEHMRHTEFELVVLVEGIDPPSSCTLQARHSYSAALGDFVFDSRFAQCVSRDTSTGAAVIDLDCFHKVKPAPIDCTATELPDSYA